MKRRNRFIILYLLPSILVVGAGIFLYDYGRPIQAEGYLITSDGERIRMPEKDIHIAYTDFYLFTTQFYQAVNNSGSVLWNAFTFLGIVAQSSLAVAGLASIVYAWYKYFHKKTPPDFYRSNKTS